MELLMKRYDRIKTEIYEKRVSEIIYHQEVFDNHKEVKNFKFFCCQAIDKVITYLFRE